MCSVKLQQMKNVRPSSRKPRTPSSRIKKHPEDFVKEGITCNEDNCNKGMNYYSSYDRLGFLFDNVEKKCLNCRHLRRTHQMSSSEAQNILQCTRKERLEKFEGGKRKCPECRTLFSIKKSLDVHLRATHGWSQDTVLQVVNRNQADTTWLYMSDTDTD